MTTSTTTPRLSYTADGSTAAFTFNFEIADSSSIAVYVGSTLKTLTTDYTVSFDTGTSGTGTVTFTSAPSSGTVTLIRDTNLARTVDFQEGGAFLAATVNAEFDRLSQAVIDSTDKIEKRAILLAEPNTETATLTVADASTRANKVLAFDGSGEVAVADATGTVTNIATGTGLTGGPITGTGTIAIDSTVATLTGSQTLTNKTLTSPVISSISNTGTVTLPTATDTLVGRATTDTLTNKTINSASNTITITESNISDLGSYITASSTDTLTNKSGNISQWTNNSGYIANTVEDTTPQLGGNLDLNSNTINGTGTINITGDITGTNIRATGNLTVDGTTTTLNTQNLSIEDAFIELNRNNSSTATDADAGIFIRNGYSGAGTDYNPAFYWDHGEQKFKFMITDVDPSTSPASLNDGTTLLANVSMGTLSSGGITAAGTSNFYGFNVKNNSTGASVLLFRDNNITGLRSNEDINITPAGTGTVNISSLTLASGASVTAINDEDTMSSNSATALATQQSIKAYVDGEIGGIGLDASITQGNSSVTVTDSGTGQVTMVADGNTNVTVSANEVAMGTDVRISDNVNDHFIGNIKNDGGNSLQLTTESGNAGINLTPHGTGSVVVYSTLSTVGGHLETESIRINAGSGLISGRRSNEDISIQPAGTGNVILGAIKIDGTTISSDDSTQITIAENIQTTGSLDTNAITGTTIDASTDVTTPRIETASGDLTIAPGSGGSTTIENNNGTVNLGNSGSFTIFSNGIHRFQDKAVWDNNLEINDNYIKTTASNSDLELSASGTGKVSISGDLWPTSGAINGYVLQTDGAGNLSWSPASGSTGDLTIVGSTISSPSNGDLTLQTTGTGNVVLENLTVNNDGAVVTAIKDEDNFASNSATALATQQSIKAYVDTQDEAIGSDTLTFTNKTFDANATGNSISNIEVTDLAGSAVVTAAEGIASNNNDTTIPTSAAVKAYADSVASTATGLTFVGDDSTGTLISDGETIKIAGATGITTAVSGDTLTVTGPDLSSYITASSTDTLTNKTFDANGTGNSISNIETADIAAGTLVTAAEGIGSNNNDTTIPTSAAVKAYADSVGGGGGGSVGDLSIIGSTISAPSNGDLNLTTSGTGYVQLKANGGDFDNYSTQTRYANSNLMYWEDLDHTIANDRQYKNNIITNIKLTAGQDTSNSNDRWRQIFRNTLDLNGSSTTPVSSTFSRGPMGMDSTTEIKNTNSGTTSRLGNASGNQAGVLVDTNGGGNISFEAADSSSTNAGVAGNTTYVEMLAGSGTTITIPTAINYLSTGVVREGSGTTSVTDSYAFYANANSASSSITNEYGFYTADDSMINSIGGVTLQNGDIQTQAVSITDNLITTNRSNDDLRLSANGTGRIGISTDGSDFWNNALYNQYYGNPNGVVKTLGISTTETVDANTASRNYVIGVAQNTTLSGSSTSNSQFRQRTLNLANSMDMAGYSFTQVSSSRGPKAASFGTNIVNSSSTASTLYTTNPGEFFCSSYSDDATYSAGDLTITAPIGVKAVMELYSGVGSGNFTYTDARGFFSKAYVHTNDTITDHYLYHAQPGNDGAGGTITNSYGYYVAASTGGVGTNYAFYDASNSLSVFGDIQTQAVSITDNHITTNRSNDHLNIEANGTGRVNIGLPLEESALFEQYMGSKSRIKGGAITYEDLAVNPNDLTDREYGASVFQGTRITASSTNSNFRPRALVVGSTVDLDGFSYTNTSNFRGPLGAMIIGSVLNTSGTNSTINTVRGVESSAAINDFTNSAGDITITNAIGNYCANFIERNGSGDATVTNAYNFFASGDSYNAGTGTNSVTNQYGFYFEGIQNITPTNNYAFYDASNSLSRFGAVILANQAGDPSGVTDSAHIYAKDDAGSSEVYVRDEAGNVTKISPHNAAGEWEYYSVNKNTGKTVRVNMERMIKKLEELTGETFIESE